MNCLLLRLTSRFQTPPWRSGEWLVILGVALMLGSVVLACWR